MSGVPNGGDVSSTPKRFRKKPVEIRALRWLPEDLEAAGYLVGWLMAHDVDYEMQAGGALSIVTLEGAMLASRGDWIIQGVAGEFYPCKPDIFEATYEPA